MKIHDITTWLRLERSVFLRNFEKKIFFFDILIPFANIFPGNMSMFQKFAFEVPTFKEIVLICIMKVRDLLLTLLQVITRLAEYFQK